MKKARRARKQKDVIVDDNLDLDDRRIITKTLAKKVHKRQAITNVVAAIVLLTIALVITFAFPINWFSLPLTPDYVNYVLKYTIVGFVGLNFIMYVYRFFMDRREANRTLERAEVILLYKENKMSVSFIESKLSILGITALWPALLFTIMWIVAIFWNGLNNLSMLGDYDYHIYLGSGIMLLAIGAWLWLDSIMWKLIIHKIKGIHGEAVFKLLESKKSINIDEGNSFQSSVFNRFMRKSSKYKRDWLFWVPVMLMFGIFIYAFFGVFKGAFRVFKKRP